MAIKLKSYYTVEYSDLEKIIKEHLGISYEILPFEEVGGDNSYVVHYVGEREWGTYEEQILTDLRAGKPVIFSLSTLMHALYLKGAIPKGEYLIDCAM